MEKHENEDQKDHTLRIVFMGTPDFAVPVLDRLVAKYGKGDKGVVAVVTVPDRPKGRGQKMAFSPIKDKALSLGISEEDIIQPESMKDPAFEQKLAGYGADIFCVVAFRILPENIFLLPKIASFNIHGSLLPKYRGAAPINRAVMEGETESGLTTFILQKKVDTGNLLLREKIEIGPDMTAGELHDSLMPMAADIAEDTIELLLSGDYTPLPQDDSAATPAPKIFRDDCHIDFSQSAQHVHNHIRGLSPYPAAWTLMDGKNLKVLKAEKAENHKVLGAGEYEIDNTAFLVGCCDGALRLLTIQPEGKRAVSAEDFIRGFRGEKKGKLG